MSKKFNKQGLGYQLEVPWLKDIKCISDIDVGPSSVGETSSLDTIDDSSLHIIDLFQDNSIFMISTTSSSRSHSSVTLSLVYPDLIDWD